MNLQLVTLADRRATYALLDRMLDWLPPARLSTRKDPDAPTGSTWRRCNRCAGSGRVTGEGTGAKPCRQSHPQWDATGRTTAWPYRHGCRPCLNCEVGWIRVGGEPSTAGDPMLSTGKHELDDQAQVKAERRRMVDAQILKLQAHARERGDDGAEEAPDDDLTRALRAKDYLYRTGSFRRLEAALLLLAATYPLRHEAVRVFVIEAQAEPSPRVRVNLDQTVDWLAERLPRPILLPADAVREVEAWKRSLEDGRTPKHRMLRVARDLEIHDLATAHGWSQRRIAEHYALSQTGVVKILDRASQIVATAPAA